MRNMRVLANAGRAPAAGLAARVSRAMSSLTPAEAGRRAAELVAQKCKSTTTRVDTSLAHAGVVDKQHNTAMSPPLHMATTYTRPPDGEYLVTDSIYSRMDNPTRLLLEQEISKLHGYGLNMNQNETKDAPEKVQPSSFAFSSGMMAATALVLAHQTPLTVLLPLDLYHGVSTVMHDVFTKFANVTVKRVDWRMLEDEDVTQFQQMASEIPVDHSVIVWIETPSNPLCHVIDIERVCSWVHANTLDATLVVDSTLAPPTIQQPLRYPVDVVMHSATKYLAGHSDALLGTLTTNPTTRAGQRLAERLHQVQEMTGGVASTMDAWLCLRGLRTLAVRVRQQCQSAQRIAEFLERQAAVTAVHYPGLPSHPQYEIAQQQMSMVGGGVLSFDMGTEVRAVSLAAALQIIQRATSLGGTETLIEHRASIEPEGRVTSPPGLLRLSVGLEDADDLLADLQQALDIMQEVCS
eukprot:scaffold5158_cov153-Amphora_coffeaeformis.AAC.5